MKVEHTVVINRPVGEVFSYLTNPDNLPEWQSGVTEARKEGEGLLGAGSRLTEVRTFLGKRISSTLEVTAYEPDREFSIRVVTGPIPFAVRHVFEPADGGTRITFSGEGEPGNLFKLAEPLVARAVKRQSEADFATLKRVLEARA